MKKQYSKEISRKIIFLIIITIIFFLIFIINNKTFLAIDDFGYHFIYSRFPNNNTKLITSLSDIVVSMTYHWNDWGGRVITHGLLQLTFMFGQTFFNIINSIMYILLGILIYKHINPPKKYNILLILFIYTMMFLFIPEPAATVIWKSGSANYLWSTNFLLIMTLIYKKHLDDKQCIKNNFSNAILIFLYGFIVGCSNENTGCALIAIQLIYIFCYKIKHKKIPIWSISGLISTIIGYIFLLIAPGNYVRQQIMYEKVDLTIETFFERFLDLTNIAFNQMTPIIILTIITSIIIYKHKEPIKNIKEKYKHQIIYLIFSLISVYSLIISPAYPERCLFFAFTYLLITVGININYLDYTNDYLNKTILIIICFLTIATISDYGEQYKSINSSYKTLSKLIVDINEQKQQGITDITVPYYANHQGKYNIYRIYSCLSNDRNSWCNSWVAKYYDVNSISTN